jgi:excisionase family DNA binding protein
MKQQTSSMIAAPINSISRAACPSDIMTVGELATKLRCHPATIYRLVKQRKLPAFRVGYDWRFSSQTIESWIEAQHSNVQ